MSRRREAAELARVLLLSTQEATTVSHLSPHTLSSSKSGSQDSKEMELQAVVRPSLSSIMSVPSSVTSSAVPQSSNHWGQPPVVRTVAQDQQGLVPRNLPSHQPSDPIVTATTPSNGMTSNIASFTPTRPSPVTQHTTYTLLDRRPSPSVPHSTPTVASGRAPYSSPNMPIPSSRLSNGKATDSSGGSSHRPLFSPTQTSSRLPGSSAPTASIEAPKPKPVTTYGKNRDGPAFDLGLVAGPSTKRQTSPLKAAGPPLLLARPRFPMSDDEEFEPVEEVEPAEPTEPVEIRPVSIKTPKSTMEVVLPSRSNSLIKETPKSRSRQHDSPDPLDTNIRRHYSPETFPLDRIPAPLPIVPSVPSSNRSSATTKSSATDSQRTNKSNEPARVSKRQQVQKEKEEAEKEARREARRIRKEKEKLEQERMDAEAKRSRDRDTKRGRVEEESIIPLDGPPKSRERSRTSVSERVTKSPVKVPSDIIEIDDESLPEAIEMKADDLKERKEVTDNTPKPVANTKKRKNRDEEEEIEQDWLESEEEGYVPKKKATPASSKETKKAKEKAAKGKAAKEKAEKAKAQVQSAEKAMEVRAPIEDAGPVAVEDELSPAPDEEVVEQEKQVVLEEAASETPKTVSPSKSVSAASASLPSERSPLKPISNGVNTPRAQIAHRPSPGPSTGPKGYQWKTERSDLAPLLSKFGGARQSGMSRRNKIVSLHTKIGPPAKVLPPPPPKPSKKKKDDSDEEDSDDGMESDGQGGMRKKIKQGSLAWLMMED